MLNTFVENHQCKSYLTRKHWFQISYTHEFNFCKKSTLNLLSFMSMWFKFHRSGKAEKVVVPSFPRSLTLFSFQERVTCEALLAFNIFKQLKFSLWNINRVWFIQAIERSVVVNTSSLLLCYASCIPHALWKYEWSLCFHWQFNHYFSIAFKCTFRLLVFNFYTNVWDA